MAVKKKWFNVVLEKSVTVRIYAEDEENARDKAEVKMGESWMANHVWEEVISNGR